MSDEIKLGRLSRDLTPQDIEIRQADDKTVRLSFPASSEAPVERYFGIEVLSHEAGAIRMDRLSAGAAPLLFNHDWSDPVGMIDGARVRDGRLVVDAHLFDTARAAEVHAMVRGGLRNVSIGYEIDEMREDAKKAVYTATRWTPLEVSIVTVPADASVGIGRDAGANIKAVRILRAESEPVARATSLESIAMSEQAAATGASVEPKVVVTEDHTNRLSIEQLEQQRQKAIRNLAKANQCDERYVDRWIRSGASLETVAENLLTIQQQRGDEASRTFLDIPKKELGHYSITRALRASQSKNWTNAGLELEANLELCKRLNKVF